MKGPFWIALQFLSSLPVRLPGMPSPRETGRSLLYYPLVGLVLGVVLYGANAVLSGAPLMLHAALLLTVWVLFSGGLHLDGLADSADAWLGGFGDRERTLVLDDGCATTWSQSQQYFYESDACLYRSSRIFVAGRSLDHVSQYRRWHHFTWNPLGSISRKIRLIRN